MYTYFFYFESNKQKATSLTLKTTPITTECLDKLAKTDFEGAKTFISIQLFHDILEFHTVRFEGSASKYHVDNTYGLFVNLSLCNTGNAVFLLIFKII